jgi:GNAT superfamily N-acetyltransferase
MSIIKIARFAAVGAAKSAVDSAAEADIFRRHDRQDLDRATTNPLTGPGKFPEGAVIGACRMRGRCFARSTPPAYAAEPVMPRSNALLAPAPSGGCEIDSDKTRLDLALIHAFLVRSHWAEGIPFAVMKKAIDNSLAFGLYRDGSQIGFARVVTDHATFAYLADVFVVEGERGKGLGRTLVETIRARPELQGLRRWLLVTRDAQNLYHRCGFETPPSSYSFLERVDRGIYSRP